MSDRVNKPANSSREMKIPTTINSSRLYEELSIYNDANHTSNGNTHNNYQEHDDSTPVLDGDFSEYLWMENEEQFDREVLAELEEEELIEQCMEAMIEEMIEGEYQQNSHRVPPPNAHAMPQTSSNIIPVSTNRADDVRELCESMDKVSTSSYHVGQSTLNPLAAEFVPSSTGSSSGV